ncbi:MAG TPA: LssY C-terminal domain-containing protein [Edaphobacter sp.]|nr:LssY C-terminal domain-containing protein [Edaphobacter sp.]
MLAVLLGTWVPAWGQTSTPESTPPPPVTPVTPIVTPPTPTPIGPRVEPIVSMRDKPAVSPTTVPHKQSYDFTLKDGDWLDTGIVLGAGELANFTATGSFLLSDAREVGPDGLDRGWKDLLRQFPLNQAKVGALIGRVSDMGATVPFSIGAGGQVTMPTSGRLFLRANVSNDLTATGSFKVKVKFAPVAKPTSIPAPQAGTVAITKLISPEMFEDIPRRISDEANGEGHQGDMVNFALVGTKEQVEAAYKAAGWVAVDKSVQDAILNGLLKTLNHEAYTEMPMSTLYLFGRPQDMSFARADPLLVAAVRHHLRIWQTDKTLDGKPLWVGSATHDIGFEKDQRNGKMTHKIDPEIDKEREFLLQSFDAAGVFSSAAYVTPEEPMLKAQTATGGSFYSDGRIVVMALK